MNLLIESFEGGIYLAYQVIGEQKQLIKDDHQHPMKFLSINQARDHFSDQGVASAMLVYNSAYDEMCGEYCGNTQPFDKLCRAAAVSVCRDCARQPPSR